MLYLLHSLHLNLQIYKNQALWDRFPTLDIHAFNIKMDLIMDCEAHRIWEINLKKSNNRLIRFGEFIICWMQHCVTAHIDDP